MRRVRTNFDDARVFLPLMWSKFDDSRAFLPLTWSNFDDTRVFLPLTWSNFDDLRVFLSLMWSNFDDTWTIFDDARGSECLMWSKFDDIENYSGISSCKRRSYLVVCIWQVTKWKRAKRLELLESAQTKGACHLRLQCYYDYLKDRRFWCDSRDLAFGLGNVRMNDRMSAQAHIPRADA